MLQSLQQIFELEDERKFDEAFDAYNELYNQDTGYEVWKHFYFFLWTAIEDASSSFHDRINLRHLLQTMLEEGKRRYPNVADFNFIAGYTVSIFPYEFGNYDDLENEGGAMLRKATKLEPDNIIYKMVYLTAGANSNSKQYEKAVVEAASTVLETFKGAGALNKYFRQVLYRVDKEGKARGFQ